MHGEIKRRCCIRYQVTTVAADFIKTVESGGLLKIVMFFSSKVTVILADLHSFLDNRKTQWNLMSSRSAYFEKVIREMLLSIGAPIEKVSFVRGTDYQLDK